MREKHHVLMVDLAEQEKRKVVTGGSPRKNVYKPKCFYVTLQSPALNLRFDTSLIYKRQANVSGETLRSIKTKEPRLVAWRPSTTTQAEGMGSLMVEISRAAGRVPHMERKTEPPTFFAAL